MAKKLSEPISIPKPNYQLITIPIVGDTSLISHKFGDSAMKAIQTKQGGTPKPRVKPPRDPQKEYEESLYMHPSGGYGFPASAFKEAVVEACSIVPGITKTMAAKAFSVLDAMVKIKSEDGPIMRTDRVNIGKFPNKVADLRYRGEFPTWSTELTVKFNADIISKEQLVNLFEHAGSSISIGDWRVEKGGSFGMFHVERANEKKRAA